jgi:hypothetical protein
VKCERSRLEYSFPRGLGRFAVILALGAALAVPAMAQQSRVYRDGGYWVEEVSGSLAAATTMSIKLDLGNVIVQGGTDAGISYVMKVRVRASSEAEARQQLERFRFSATRNGDTAVFEGNAPGHWRSIGGELLVRTPRALETLKAVTRGGNESVTGINGRVELWTAGGNVHLDEIGGSVAATTGGGNVDVGGIGADLTLKTGGGNVHINSVKGKVVASSGGGNIVVGSAAQGLSVQTGGGNIDVKNCGGQLMAQSGGGSLDLGQVAGKATLQTGGGNIRLSSASGPVTANTGGGGIELFGLTQGANVQTGSGEIVAEFLAGDFTGSSLQTPSGDVIVYLGPNLKATIRAAIEQANGHHIRSDFPEIKVNAEGGQFGPRTIYAEGNLNGGGPVLKVRTSSGDIEFRRTRK